METKLTTVAKVNGVDILIIEGDEKRVAIKPICEALGIAFQRQIERLKEDPILGSTVTLGVTVGADGKQREMVTIPFKFVFGWLFRIDSRNVKEESREAVEKYQLHCYNALYDSLYTYQEFVQYRSKRMKEEFVRFKEAKNGYSQARARMNSAEADIDQALQLTYEMYLAQKSQMQLDFNQESEANNA
jgi:hypothetical protein